MGAVVLLGKCTQYKASLPERMEWREKEKEDKSCQE